MSNRIRVIHCLQAVHSGGVERRRLSLAEKLDPKRFEQMVICTEASPELRQQFEDAGCEVVAIGRMKKGIHLSRIVAAARHMREFRPDIVHGAVYEGVILAALAGRLARVPVIVGEETIYPVGRRFRGHLYYRFLVAATHQMVAISRSVDEYLTETIRIPRSKVRLLYNGVRETCPGTTAELQQLRSQFGIADQNIIIIGTVGRLVDSHKRTSDAIRAMRLIVEREPHARLLVVGDGPDRPKLVHLVANLGLESAVIFAGFQPRPRPFYDLMDILVHPPMSEGLPLVLVEAMYASLPIVATRVPGVTDVAVDGATAFLVPPQKPDALADRILQLSSDAGLRERMGAAGLERARQHFSEERYVSEVAALYEELAAQRLSRRGG